MMVMVMMINDNDDGDDNSDDEHENRYFRKNSKPHFTTQTSWTFQVF